MPILEKKYGFPLFTRGANNIYLGNDKKIIISEIWSFWDYVIKKRNYEKGFMGSLLEQAKNFYIAAEASPIKSKPLLYYYSFLNLAKIIINIERNYGSAVSYHHGLSENHHQEFQNSTVTVRSIATGVKNVASELLYVLDNRQITGNTTINIKDHLTHCVGIHRAYSEIYNSQEIFVRLDEFEFKREGQILISRAKAHCKNNTQAMLLQNTGYNLIQEDGAWVWEERVTTNTYTVTRNSYYNVSQHLRNKGMWYFIGDKGYTVYLSCRTPQGYPPEIIIYNTMFFLGSITRYHPYLFDTLFSDKEQWLMSEFLTTQPKQFLYLCTAKILGQNVMKAYSSF